MWWRVLSYAVSLALQDNLFEWHFTIRGPPDTEFEGGMYHGRILLPTEYPFSPPSIVLLTPNGRFETKMKVCLSISAYHPETWLPAWGSTLTSACLLTARGGGVDVATHCRVRWHGWLWVCLAGFVRLKVGHGGRPVACVGVRGCWIPCDWLLCLCTPERVILVRCDRLDITNPTFA